MEIVLIVAVLVVAAAVLYMTVTLSTRTRQSTAPLIDDAYKGVAGQVDTATQDLKRQIHDELQKDREQRRLDGREVQGRLDHLDSQASGMANQVMAELATIGRLVEQLGARQDQMRADLGKLDHRVARLDESVARASQPHAVPAGPGTTPAAGPASSMPNVSGSSSPESSCPLFRPGPSGGSAYRSNARPEHCPARSPVLPAIHRP